MKQLHPVFNVVKLTLAPDDLITGWKTEDYPLSIVINGEAEWEVEEILDSRWHQRRFQYLICKGTPPFPPLTTMTTLRSYLSLFTSDT